MVEHDPSASQATFVEISFGINLLWAAFERFRDVFKKSLTNKIEIEIGAVRAVEAENKSSHGVELASLTIQAAAFDTKHLRFQESAVGIAKLFTIATSIACVLILYFDLLGMLGRWLGLLLLPLPGYVIIAMLGFLYIRFRIWWLTRKYTDFIKTFKLSPASIKQEVESLDKPNGSDPS
jgi:hypothetical protein